MIELDRTSLVSGRDAKASRARCKYSALGSMFDPREMMTLLLFRTFTASSISKTILDMVEVRGVEPLSETESAKLLRVYPAFSLGRSKRTSALSPDHPFGSAPCSTRAESPAAWPARLSLPAQQTSAVRLRGLKRRRDSNRCSQLQFFLVFYVANENPRRAI